MGKPLPGRSGCVRKAIPQREVVCLFGGGAVELRLG